MLALVPSLTLLISCRTEPFTGRVQRGVRRVFPVARFQGNAHAFAPFVFDCFLTDRDQRNQLRSSPLRRPLFSRRGFKVVPGLPSTRSLTSSLLSQFPSLQTGGGRMCLALPAAILRQEMSNLLYGANISKLRAALGPAC